MRPACLKKIAQIGGTFTRDKKTVNEKKAVIHAQHEKKAAYVYGGIDA